MTTEYKTSAEFKKSARVVSDYEFDMIFEQPRQGLAKQVFTSYEYQDNGLKITETTRTFTTMNGYDDVTAISILPFPKEKNAQ